MNKCDSSIPNKDCWHSTREILKVWQGPFPQFARNQTQGSWLELPLNYDNNHQSSQKHKTLYTYCIVSHKEQESVQTGPYNVCARTS